MIVRILLIALSTTFLATICNAKSTGSSITTDSLQKVVPRPIVLTEAGARLALQYKSRYETAVQVIAQKDQQLSWQRTALSQKDSTLTQLNRNGQATSNQLQQCRQVTEQYRQKLRAARWENWAVRIGAGVYLVLKVRAVLAGGR